MSTINGTHYVTPPSRELSTALTPTELTRLTLYRQAHTLILAGIDSQYTRGRLMFLRWAYEHGRIAS
jgi:hypothetical protein